MSFVYASPVNCTILMGGYSSRGTWLPRDIAIQTHYGSRVVNP
jgi:hypothetical protein